MSAHLWDYITDRTSREAIARKEYGAGGGDCAPALNAARKNGATICVLPDGWIPLASSVTLQNFALQGESGNAGAIWPYATHGAVIEIRDQNVKPLLLGENWGLERLAVYYPLQLPKAGEPDAYAPLLSPIANDTNVSGGQMDRCAVINAYVLAELGGNDTYAKAGQNGFTNSRLCALKDLFVLNHMPDWLSLAGSQCGWDLFGDPMMGYEGAPFNASWRDWVTANSVAFRIKGNGTGQSVDGPVLTPAVFYGYDKVFLIEAGGVLANLTAEGLMADACRQLIRVEPGGGIAASKIALGGGCYQHRKGREDEACAPFVDIDNPSACEGFTVTGRLQESKGPLYRIRGANVADADIRLSCSGFARTTTAGEYWAGEIDTPAAQISGETRIRSQAASASGVTRNGVKITAAASSDMLVQSDKIQTPAQIDAATGSHTIKLNTTNTGGSKSLVMANPACVSWSGKMDKGPQTEAIASAGPTDFAGSNTALTVTQIDLEAGTWDISAAAEISAGSGSVANLGYSMISISSTAGVLSGLTQRIDKRAGFNSALAWADGLTLRAGPAPVVLAAPATIYVVCQAGYTLGTPASHPRAKASITARRVLA